MEESPSLTPLVFKKKADAPLASLFKMNHVEQPNGDGSPKEPFLELVNMSAFAAYWNVNKDENGITFKSKVDQPLYVKEGSLPFYMHFIKQDESKSFKSIKVVFITQIKDGENDVTVIGSVYEES